MKNNSETVEEFVVFLSDTGRPLPIGFRVFVEVARVTIVAHFGNDWRLSDNKEIR